MELVEYGRSGKDYGFGEEEGFNGDESLDDASDSFGPSDDAGDEDVDW